MGDLLCAERLISTSVRHARIKPMSKVTFVLEVEPKA
jgi:hypothetical protein